MLPVLLMWVVFSVLFAIIGDTFNNIKEGFGGTPTVLADLQKLTACSVQSVTQSVNNAPARQTHTLMERCWPSS
jgi:hypothetical protein